jgi:hypothetical protein
VALVRTDVSEERTASFIRVTTLGELGTLMEEALLSSSETSVLTRVTWLNIPEDGVLHSHRRESLKPYTALLPVCHNCPFEVGSRPITSTMYNLAKFLRNL